MEINLQEVTINSFKGIDTTKAVFLDLGKAYMKGKNITVFKGDQGAGKSSTMEGIMYMLGHNFPWDTDNLVNLTDDTINENALLTIDGVEHRIKVTKSKFSFERYLADIGKWNGLDEPRTTLQRLIGPIGISPMFLKEKPGPKQIEWFRNTFGADETLEKKEEKMKADVKKLAQSYKDANRDFTKIKKALELNDLWRNAEENYKRFETQVTIDAAKSKFEETSKKMELYSKAQDKLDRIKESIELDDEELLGLEEKIRRVKLHREDLLQQKEKGEQYIAENVMVSQDHQEAQKEYMEINKTLNEQEQWQSVLNMKKEMDEYETTLQHAESQKDKILLKLQELTKKYLPDIEGLEIRVAKGMDNDEEGIFYKNKTIAQLSESELWSLYLEICMKKEIRFVFIENVSSLGSDAMAVINTLANQGVKIFASKMDRKVDKLKFTMTDTID